MTETIKVQVRVIRTRSQPEEQTPTGIILFPHTRILDAVPEKPTRQKPKYRRWTPLPASRQQLSTPWRMARSTITGEES